MPDAAPDHSSIHTVDETRPHAFETPASRFHGLGGWFAQVANFGVIGVVAALMCWLVMYQMPAVLSQARQDIREERENSRADAAESRKHGTEAALGLQKSIEVLGERFEKSQDALQESQKKIVESLETQTRVMRGNRDMPN